MNQGFIFLHRQFLDWEWYKDNNTKSLFIHLLLKANHKDNYFKGILIKRGQLMTGLDVLNFETNISIQTLRTSLKRLEKTKEINRQVTNKYSIITVCKYDEYQKILQPTNKQTNKQLTIKQQATNKQLTANNNVNKEKNDNIKDIKFNFKNSLLDLGIEKQVVEDWLKVRKTKSATNTETAFNSIKSQIEKSDKSANECIKLAVEKDWKGFNNSWLNNSGNNGQVQKSEFDHSRIKRQN